MKRFEAIPMHGSLVTVILLGIAACGGGGGGGDSSPGPGPEPANRTITIGDDRIIDEGSSGNATDVQFSVSLDAPATGTVTVDYAVTHVTTEDPDFSDSSGTVTFAVGSSQATITLSAVPDTAFELNEEFRVVLSNPSSNATIGDGEASGILVNDDPLTAFMDLVNLGYFNGSFVGASVDIDYDLLIDTDDLLRGLGLAELLIPYDIYYTSDIHIPFIVASGHLRIVLGSGGSGTIVFVLPQGLDNLAIGGNFLVTFDWSSVFDGLPSATWEFLVLVEQQDIDASTPILSVSNAVVLTEGDAGSTSEMRFHLSLSEALSNDVHVTWSTIDATATSPQDYDAASGSVTLVAGSTEAEIGITANGDDEPEGTVPETFIVSLTAETDAAILSYPWATGTIYDDDTVVEVRRISVQNAELIEGDSGTADMEFTVALDAPAITPVTFSYATSNREAESGSDYQETTGERTIDAGESQLTIRVPIFGDTEPEDDETFVLGVTNTFGNATIGGDGVGTIRTDDPIARVSVVDVALAEGDSGTTTFTLTVMLSEALDVPLDIRYATNDLTAMAGEDYTAVDSVLTIPAGDTVAPIDISVSGDTDAEDDEVFELVISTDSEHALVTDDTCTGTILNDDSAGGWAGAELVFQPDVLGGAQAALQPQVGFGPGGERQILFYRGYSVWHTISPARSVWTPPEELATIDSAYPPGFAVDSAGNALTVLPKDFLESHSYLAGSEWQPEGLPLAVGVENTLHMASDPASGEAVVVWREPANAGNNNSQSVWAAHYLPGTGWTDMGLVENADPVTSHAEVAMATNGDVITVFPQAPTVSGFSDIVAYHLDGSTWAGPTILDSVDGEYAKTPKIDMNANGDAAVAWFQTEPVASGLPRESIYMSRYDANNDAWSVAQLVEEELAYTARDPDVAIDGDGNVFVVWLQQSPDYSTENLYGNRYDAAADAWSGVQLLELDDTAGSRPIISQQVVADDLGNAIVVWIQNDGVLQNVRAARYSATDAEWKPAEMLEEIDTGDANIPQLVIDRTTGNAMAVWHLADGSRIDVWANRYTNN